MELRRLRYFVAVAEAGNLTRAAARLGLEQPPLSVQIHALEAALGAQLFTRLPRGMALTAAGEALLPEARAILHAASAAAALVADVAKGRRERITLGVTTSAIMHPRVRTILGTLTRLYPDMRLTLREGSAAELTELLGAGTMQAAFIRAVVARPAGIRFQELCSEEMVAVLPSAHRLARARPGVRLEDLAGERFVFVRRAGAPGMYAELVRAAATLGFEPLVVAEVERMLTSANLVAAGLGVSVVPRSMRDVQVRGITYRRLLGPASVRAPLTLAVAEQASPAVERLLAIARAPAE